MNNEYSIIVQNQEDKNNINDDKIIDLNNNNNILIDKKYNNVNKIKGEVKREFNRINNKIINESSNKKIKIFQMNMIKNIEYLARKNDKWSCVEHHPNKLFNNYNSYIFIAMLPI